MAVLFAERPTRRFPTDPPDANLGGRHPAIWRAGRIRSHPRSAQKAEGRDVSHDVQNAPAPDCSPARSREIDLTGREGRLCGAPRGRGSRLDVGQAGRHRRAHYESIADRIVSYRAETGILHSTSDLDKVPPTLGRRPHVAESELLRRTVRTPFGGERRASGRRRPAQEGALAVIWSIAAMLAYIAIRSARFPSGSERRRARPRHAITIGLLALLGREFNLVVVAALLTLIGYSVNDTVVVYDRVRENHARRRRNAQSVHQRSINQTLSVERSSARRCSLPRALFFLGERS